MPGIVVLGGDGMLGHKMFQTLGRRFPGTHCTLRSCRTDARLARIPLFQADGVIDGLDVTDEDACRRMLEARRPDVVINCVGVIKQRDAAQDPIPSLTINALLPHKLAAWLRPANARLIHFSTDCVFSGDRGGYGDDDPPDAQDLYGRSKSLGEVRGAPHALTLRTSIIGRELFHHQSLLDWFLAQRGRTVRGFSRVIYSGVTTNHLATLVGDIIERHRDLSGLYQVASAPISKHDLLQLLKQAYDLDVEILADPTVVSDRSLNGERFAAATGYRCPPWPRLVAELAADPTPYADWVDQQP
jgi:dTDP-4-dehydrorhamnose reductase